MTPVERTEAIKDKAAATLPALLTAAGLDDFDRYRNKSPQKSNDLEFCVYIDSDDNTTSSRAFGVVIQCQIYGKDQAQEYHSVIMPFLEEYITAELIEYEYRDGIRAEVWPMDNSSTSFVFYSVMFLTENDDCDL